jgi:hypothetical protein
MICLLLAVIAIYTAKGELIETLTAITGQKGRAVFVPANDEVVILGVAEEQSDRWQH